MSDAVNDRFVPALRRAWRRLEAGAFSELGRGVISGAELRAFLGNSIAGRSEENRSVKSWNALSQEDRDAALAAAFPGESYTRTPPKSGDTGA